MFFKINIYRTKNGNYPFNDWLHDMDNKNINSVTVRLKRIEQGNFNNCKPVRQEIYEIVIDVGPGFRVYYANIQNSVLVLTGGIKRTQKRDISKAIEYLEDYKIRCKYGKG